MRLAVALQTFGIAGLIAGVILLFGVGVAVLVGSVCAVAAGIALERQHGPADFSQKVFDAIREYERRN